MSESATQTPSTGVQPRKQRRKRVGVVETSVRDKTLKVRIDRLDRHPKYGKYLQRRIVLHAHDEKNEAKDGDVVEIMECRPISKTKSWRLVRIVRRVGEH
jgi:small subunit ribosomal protein S17